MLPLRRCAAARAHAPRLAQACWQHGSPEGGRSLARLRTAPNYRESGADNRPRATRFGAALRRVRLTHSRQPTACAIAACSLPHATCVRHSPPIVSVHARSSASSCAIRAACAALTRRSDPHVSSALPERPQQVTVPAHAQGGVKPGVPSRRRNSAMLAACAAIIRCWSAQEAEGASTIGGGSRAAATGADRWPALGHQSSLTRRAARWSTKA